MDLVRKKDNRTGIIISVVLHLCLLLFILLSKGCVELQNPPQFTLEEVVVLDFSEKGGGSPGSSSPQQPQPVVQEPAPKEVTQEESPVETPTSSNTQQTTSQETTSEPVPEPQQPKNDFSNLFGHGSGDNQGGNGQGQGTGIGTGDGPDTGGGMGDGKGRKLKEKKEMDNPKNWTGHINVYLIVDASGNVINVEFISKGTSIVLSNSDKQFIINDCKKKIKFYPKTSGTNPDRIKGITLKYQLE